MYVYIYIYIYATETDLNYLNYFTVEFELLNYLNYFTVVIAKSNLKRHYSFFSKRNIIFFGKKEHKLVNKTALYYYA